MNRVENNKVALSIDVEDWFCVKNMSKVLPYDQWQDEWIRIEQGLDFLLDELRVRNIKATFFVLGWLAEKRPEIVQKIVSDGHELGSHGYNHQGLDTMSPDEVFQDIQKSVEVLQRLSGGVKLQGYRAPSFSVTKKTWFALELLRKLGFQYDSSVYPVSHPDYGVPDFGQAPRVVEGILEIPMNFIGLGKFRIPVSGGGYFRLFPYFLYRLFLKRALKQGNVVMYFHPWEFDPKQPKVKMSLIKSFRHYVGLDANRNKFKRLLDEFSFVPMNQLSV